MQIKIDTQELLKRSQQIVEDSTALFNELAELDASPFIETIAPELRGAMLALEDSAKATKKAQEYLVRFNAKLIQPKEVKKLRIDLPSDTHQYAGSSGDVSYTPGELLGSK